MNTVNLGQGCYGIQAAAQRYFGKNAADLTLSEATVIAGITQNPSAYDPTIYPENNAERREIVLTKLYGRVSSYGGLIFMRSYTLSAIASSNAACVM